MQVRLFVYSHVCFHMCTYSMCVCINSQYTCIVLFLFVFLHAHVFSRECSKSPHCTAERSWSGDGAILAKQSWRELKQHEEVVRSTLSCRNEEVWYSMSVGWSPYRWISIWRLQWQRAALLLLFYLQWFLLMCDRSVIYGHVMSCYVIMLLIWVDVC